MNAANGRAEKERDTGGIFSRRDVDETLLFFFLFRRAHNVISFAILVTSFQAAPCNSGCGLDYSAIEA